MKNSLLLDALKCQNQSHRPPVWLMRQAGRYMKEYQAYRSKYSFLEMVHTPEIAAKITMQPIDAFDVDAAILFSDILVIPEALGLGLHFDDGIGPIIDRPLSTLKDIEVLPKINAAESFEHTTKAIRLLKQSLKVPLLGFCGAPFTLASYMIEGQSSRDLKKTKQWMLKDPESFHLLLDLLATIAIDYLKEQIKAGINAIQIFDSWANFLGHKQFQEFSLQYLNKIVNALEETKIPIILFCRGSSLWAEQLATTKASAISIDWNGDIANIRKRISRKALQGNLDPDILCGPKDVLEKEVKSLLQSMKQDKGYIFNLGHGVLPHTPADNVKRMIEIIKSS